MRTAIRTGLAFALLAATWLIGATSATAQVKINEIRTDNQGTDTDEYFELVGPSGGSLDGLWYIVLGDNTAGRCGVIESVTNLTGYSLKTNGILCLRKDTDTPVLTGYDGAVPLIFENSDNVTHMLVSDFSGALDQDLDTNDDGVLDTTPWSAIVDCVGLTTGLAPNCAGNVEYIYCSTVLGPDGSFVPGQVYRCSDTMAWKIGLFNPLGTTDTPGVPNFSCLAPPPTFENMSRNPCVPQTSQGAIVLAVVSNATGANLHYTVNGGASSLIVMDDVLGDGTTYQAIIPGQPSNGDRVAYWVDAFNATPDTSTSFNQGYFVGTMNIGDLRVNDANGSNLYRFYGARVRGHVTAPYGVYSATNTDYYVQDATGGINVFKFGAHTVHPALGDDITVSGAIDQFDGKLELSDVGSCDTVLVTINGPGSPPAPKVINTCELGEDDEGLLIRMNHMQLEPAGDLNFVGNKNYDVVNCGADSTNMFIDADTNVPGNAITSTFIDVVGIASQFDTSIPYTGFYEIAPRTLSDITFLDPAGVGRPGDRLPGLALWTSPNPFSLTTDIRYSIPARAAGATDRMRVRLGVYDVRGRLVARLVDRFEAPGEHAVRLERSALKHASGGVYFCRLDVAGRTLTRKLVMTR